MSDVITINTADAVSEQPTQIKTFDLIPADWPVLYKEVPEFDFTKPPVDPNVFASTLVETCKKYNGLGFPVNVVVLSHNTKTSTMFLSSFNRISNRSISLKNKKQS